MVEYSILWAWNRPSCFHTRDLGKAEKPKCWSKKWLNVSIDAECPYHTPVKIFCRRFRNLIKKIASTAIEVYFSVTHLPSSKHVLMSRNSSSYFFFWTLSCIYCTVDRKIFYERRFWKLDGQFSHSEHRSAFSGEKKLAFLRKRPSDVPNASSVCS